MGHLLCILPFIPAATQGLGKALGPYAGCLEDMLLDVVITPLYDVVQSRNTWASDLP